MFYHLWRSVIVSAVLYSAIGRLCTAAIVYRSMPTTEFVSVDRAARSIDCANPSKARNKNNTTKSCVTYIISN